MAVAIEGRRVVARIGADLFSLEPPRASRVPHAAALGDPPATTDSPAAGAPAEASIAEHRVQGDLLLSALDDPAEDRGEPAPRPEIRPGARPGHRPDTRTAGASHPPSTTPPSGSDLFAAAPAHGAGGVRRDGPGGGPGGGPGRGSGTQAARAPVYAPAGPATDRQLGYAGDISKALRIPLPEGRDVETISAFIALHRHQMKGSRGRP